MATAFNVSVMASGGDYSTLNDAVVACECDLTSSTTKVFSHGSITGTMSDNTTVTGLTSGATGTCLHCSSTQILINSITGTFQNGEIIYETLGTNYIVLSNSGDSPALVITISGTWSSPDTTAVNITGYTTSAANNITITASGSSRTKGTYSASVYSLNPSSGNGIQVNSNYVIIDGLQFQNSTTQYAFSILIGTYNTNWIIKNCLFVLPSIVGSTAIGINGFIIGTANYVYNNVAYVNGTVNNYQRFFYGLNNGGAFGACNLYIYNNTGYNLYDGLSLSPAGSTLTQVISNNVMLKCTDDCFVGMTSSVSGTTNASSDTTANGTYLTSGLISETSYSNYFNSITSYDLGLASGSIFIAAGTSESGTFTTDITGATRQATGNWDVGAFKYTANFYPKMQLMGIQ